MKFSFDVKLTEKDYFEFNKFYLLRMKKHRTLSVVRIVLSVILSILGLFVILSDAYTLKFKIFYSVAILVFFLYFVFYKKIIEFSLKSTIKRLKKTGKLPFSPVATVEFYDDCFVSVTDTARAESKISAIEKVSVVDNNTVYVHLSSVSAEIIPFSAFESEAQRKEFFEFIKSKSIEITEY